MALRDSMVSWWALEETSGSRADSHGTNTLTDNNTVTSATGKIGTAASFASASSEYLSISDASQSGLDITADITIQAWIYLNSAPTGTEYTIVAKVDASGTAGSAYGIRYGDVSGMKLAAMLFDSADPNNNVNYNIAQTLSTSTWYHIVFTFKSSTSTAEWFVNGSSIGTVTNAAVNDIKNSPEPFCIGAWDGSNRFANMRIDEVAVWSRVLTGAEITELYNSGNGLSYAGTASSVNVTVSAGVNAATFSMPTYTAKTNLTLVRSTLTALFSIPTYTIVSGSMLYVASVLSSTFSIPTYVAKASANAYANTLSATFSVITYAIGLGSRIMQATLSATFTTVVLSKAGSVWTKIARNSTGSWTRSDRNND